MCFPQAYAEPATQTYAVETAKTEQTYSETTIFLTTYLLTYSINNLPSSSHLFRIFATKGILLAA